MSRVPSLTDLRWMWSCMQFSIVLSRWLRSGWPTHLGVESRHCGKNTALPSDCSLLLVWFNGLYSWSCAASVPTNFQAIISWLWGMSAFLKKHKAFATLVTQRSRCMWQQLFTMKSGCDVAKLLDLMTKGQASAQVAAQTCDLIKRHVLPKKSSELPAAVTAASCMQAVLCAMDAHLSSPEVQEQAVWCLKNLALNRPENEETVMTLGGAEAILMAMTENCSNEAVQKEGCVALAKLTTEHQNVLKFLSLGAGEAVLKALRNYTTSTGVQWWAFQALGNLAESSEGRAKLRNLLAADVINAAMSSGNSEIQEKGQQLLEKLGQVGHTGPWDVTLSCCAEASPVCKDRRGFGRGWVRWWFCVLAFLSFMLTEPWRNSLLLEWTGPTFIDGGGQFFGTASAAWCSMVQHMPAAVWWDH